MANSQKPMADSQRKDGFAMNDEERAAVVEVETEVTRTMEVGGDEADSHGTTPAGGVGDELAKVRELVLRAHPEVVPELVHGNSVDELLASVTPARSAYQQVVDRVRGGQSQSAEHGE